MHQQYNLDVQFRYFIEDNLSLYNQLRFNYRRNGKLTNPTTYSTRWSFSVGLTYYFDRNMF